MMPLQIFLTRGKMTLLERIDKVLETRAARKTTRKYAWQRVDDGHSRKQIVTKQGEQEVFIHVVGDTVYQSDKDVINVEEMTGPEADDYIASSNATMALRSTGTPPSTGIVGFGKSLLTAAELS